MTSNQTALNNVSQGEKAAPQNTLTVTDSTKSSREIAGELRDLSPRFDSTPHRAGRQLPPQQQHDVPLSMDGSSVADDVIEIHQFSPPDVDAYLDIYFETLHGRLSHFVGGLAALESVRLAIKKRIISDVNAREYQNVLIGKINDEVVAAASLSFAGDTSTIRTEHMLAEDHSCLASMRRRLIEKAQYSPTHPEECYVEMIGVKQAYRNHGIGAAMLECVEHFARQAGARLLTVHVHSEQLRGYFQRVGFVLDHSDRSAFWKWVVERENVKKMVKAITPSEDSAEKISMEYPGSYINGSMIDSLDG